MTDLNESGSGVDTIRLHSDITGFAFTALTETTALPVITEDLTIEDRVDADIIAHWTVERGAFTPAYRIFTIQMGVTATFSEVTVRLGVATQGGGIHLEERAALTLPNSVVRDNDATSVTPQRQILGGGIYVAAALDPMFPTKLTLNDSVVTGNEVYGRGTGEMPGETIVERYGGGIWAGINSLVTIQNGSEVSNNIICDQVTIVRDCSGDLIAPKNSQFEGGGIYSWKAKLSINQTTIADNKIFPIDPNPAGLEPEEPLFPMPDAQFRGEGAGLRIECNDVDDCLVIEDSTISGNLIDIQEGSVTNASNNSRATGAGMSLNGPSVGLTKTHVRIFNSTIAENRLESATTGPGCMGMARSCTVGGAGIWFKWMVVDIKWSTIAYNVAVNETPSIDNSQGGGIHVLSQASNTLLKIQSCIIANNTADYPDPLDELENIFTTTELHVQTGGYNLANDDPPGLMTPSLDQIDKEVCFTPLGFPGGPAPTKTMRPLACGDGSVAAFNKGGDVTLPITKDQRGKDRPGPVGGDTDVGSVECQVTMCNGPGSGPGGGDEAIPPPPARSGESDSLGSSVGANTSLSETPANRDQEERAVHPMRASELTATDAAIFPRIETDLAWLDTTYLLELMPAI